MAAARISPRSRRGSAGRRTVCRASGPPPGPGADVLAVFEDIRNGQYNTEEGIEECFCLVESAILKNLLSHNDKRLMIKD